MIKGKGLAAEAERANREGKSKAAVESNILISQYAARVGNGGL